MIISLKQAEISFSSSMEPEKAKDIISSSNQSLNMIFFSKKPENSVSTKEEIKYLVLISSSKQPEVSSSNQHN